MAENGNGNLRNSKIAMGVAATLVISLMAWNFSSVSALQVATSSQEQRILTLRLELDRVIDNETSTKTMQRAVEDLYKVVYDLKKDTQDWQAREGVYDSEIRARIEILANENRETFRRQADRINDIAMRVGGSPKPSGPP